MERKEFVDGMNWPEAETTGKYARGSQRVAESWVSLYSPLISETGRGAEPWSASEGLRPPSRDPNFKPIYDALLTRNRFPLRMHTFEK